MEAGGRLECRAGDFERVLDTKADAELPHFDNYRREFEHFSRALLDGTPFAPTPEQVLADALLLDALGQDGTVRVPSAEEFLESP